MDFNLDEDQLGYAENRGGEGPKGMSAMMRCKFMVATAISKSFPWSVMFEFVVYIRF